MIDLAALSHGKRAALAGLAGAAATFGFAPFHAFPVAIAAFAFLILALRAETGAKAAFRTAFAFGYGHFAVSLHWIAYAFTVGDRFPLALGGLAVLLLAFPLALYIAFAGLAAFRLDRRVPALAFAALWTLAEMLRGWLLTGMPWNPAGAIWAVSIETLQGAALAGVWGLSFVTILCAGWLADGLECRRKLLAAVAIPALLWIGGAFAIFEPATPAAPTGPLIRIVQGNVQQDVKWDPTKAEDNFMTYVRLGRAEGRFGTPRFQVWPEAAVPYLLDEAPSAREFIASTIPANGIVLTGAVRRTGSDDNEIWFNSLMAIDGQGRVAGVYDKHHLVPFGEYVPFRTIAKAIGLGALADQQGDFGFGPGPQTLHLDGLPSLSPLICYEAIFPGEAVDPGDRPGWLAVVTNDAWFGASIGPHQHFALNRIRAVEQGLPLVRAAGTGISALVDPHGRVIDEIGLDMAGFIDVRLPAPLSATPFARTGTAPLAILLVVIVAMPLLRRRR